MSGASAFAFSVAAEQPAATQTKIAYVEVDSIMSHHICVVAVEITDETDALLFSSTFSMYCISAEG